MVNLKFDINDEEVRARLNLATTSLTDPNSITGAVGAVVRGGMVEYRGTLRYPPPQELPTYQRTYRLLDSLQRGLLVYTTPQAGIVRGKYETTGPRYDKYVVAQETQAWMHRGRWWTIESKLLGYVARSNMPEQIKSAIERVIKWVFGN